MFRLKTEKNGEVDLGSWESPKSSSVVSSLIRMKLRMEGSPLFKLKRGTGVSLRPPRFTTNDRRILSFEYYLDRRSYTMNSRVRSLLRVRREDEETLASYMWTLAGI